MGDSDEEYDRRRGRDKFRGERNDYERREDRSRSRREQWDEGNREGWNNRSREGGGGGGRVYREDYRNRRERYGSPPRNDGMSPPQKRMRRDWDDGGYQAQGYDQHYAQQQQHHHGGGWHGGPQDQHHYGQGQRSETENYPTQPPMTTFKAFLSQQEDSITDEEAIRRFNEFKVEFKKTQINEFFLAHKEEEWFKAKYHPEECDKRKAEAKEILKKRADIFAKIYGSGRMVNVAVDVERSRELIKFLDAAVILMEGGTDFDLQVLDVDESRSRNASESQPKVESTKKDEETEEADRQDKEETEADVDADDSGELKEETNDGEEKEDGEEGETDVKSNEEEKSNPLEMSMDDVQEELKKQAEEFKQQKEEALQKEKKKKKRDKTDYSYESGSDSDSGSEADSETEPAPPGVEEDGKEDTAKEETSKKAEENGEAEKDTDTKKEEEEETEPKPRAMHKTCSIFLRNLAPTITKQEVEAMCKRYPGFMRVALQDPQPERRFHRRGWVTFDNTVNIKDICWNLNNIRLRDCEMGAIVNRELKQRVRPINGLTSHKQVVRADIKHAAKIIQNLDKKWNLWEEGEEKKDKSKDSSLMSFGLVSNNPVLKNITDYLVEEGSYEEEELLGQSIDDKPKEANPEVPIERDEELTQVLDRMILYLRIVHSYDYYSAVEYPNEDEMPHRCGIIHARGSPPPNRITQNDLSDWVANFEHKVMPYLNYKDFLDESEAIKLGRKEVETEVEKFVVANTQELAKDKWLCPLSGKKFKGKDFVRKHIFNKHAEKVEEVKQEVAFFNNFLNDPKRPQLPEHPANRSGGAPAPAQRQDMQYEGGYNRGPPHMMGGGGYPQRGGYNMHYGMHRRGNGGVYRRNGGGHQGHYQSREYNNYRDNNYYRQERRGVSGGRDRFPRRDNRSHPDPRGIIEYRDLDAPEDGDIF